MWCHVGWRKALHDDLSLNPVPTGSPSRGGDVTVYVKDIKQPSLPIPFYSVLVSISVFVALSTVYSCLKFSQHLSVFLLFSSGPISA